MATQSHKKGKLSPGYIGPYDILERIGLVAYRLALPMALSNLHDVFHVSQLRKDEPDLSQVISTEAAEVQENLFYLERLVKILDCRDQVMRNKTIPLVQVLWRNLVSDELTWEWKTEMRSNFPFLFDEPVVRVGV